MSSLIVSFTLGSSRPGSKHPPCLCDVFRSFQPSLVCPSLPLGCNRAFLARKVADSYQRVRGGATLLAVGLLWACSRPGAKDGYPDKTRWAASVFRRIAFFHGHHLLDGAGRSGSRM